MLSGGAALAAILFTLGCLGGSSSNSVAQSYQKIDEIQPTALPYERAYVIFAGNPVPTQCSSVRGEGTVEFSFQNEVGTVFDVERYEFDEGAFRFVGTGFESYNPGIPILRFPFDVGEEWTWAGTYESGTDAREATAKVRTANERLNTVVGEFATVRTTVDLSIESGAAKPVEHKLVFWTAPKKGIIRREMKFGTTREPMPPVEEE